MVTVFGLQFRGKFPVHSQHFFRLHKQRGLDIQLHMDIKLPSDQCHIQKKFGDIGFSWGFEESLAPKL